MIDGDTMSKRSNFLFIITDQHRPDYLGYVGHPVLRIPHIDSIAVLGVRFGQFDVATSMCQPLDAETGRMVDVPSA